MGEPPAALYLGPALPLLTDSVLRVNVFFSNTWWPLLILLCLSCSPFLGLCHQPGSTAEKNLRARAILWAALLAGVSGRFWLGTGRVGFLFCVGTGRGGIFDRLRAATAFTRLSHFLSARAPRWASVHFSF